LDDVANRQEKDRVDELAEKIADLDPDGPGFFEDLTTIQNEAIGEMIIANGRKDYLRAAKALSLLRDIAIAKSVAQGHSAAESALTHEAQTVSFRGDESPSPDERQGTSPA
jgi:hypothetical protein